MTITNNIVYITKSNLNYILNSVYISDSTVSFQGIYEKKDLSSILSEPEIKRLVLYRDLISNQDDLTLDRYCKKNWDKRRYIYEGKPSYHKNSKCSRLFSNFQNFEIPVEIHSLAKKSLETDVEGYRDYIEEYRNFFKSNIELYHKNHQAFFAQVEMKFRVRIANVKKVDYENSGRELKNNITAERIESDIDNLLNKMEEFRNLSEGHKNEIDSLGYGSHKAKDNNIIISKWHNYKTRLKYSLEEYFRIKLNPELGLNKNILNELGFVPCKQCADDSDISDLEYDDIPF